MAKVEKTDFLRFNAYSIKELITRKLSEDTRFTDQVYEGSNLNVLIDLVAYMYQCLVYQLNNAASESMFQDTQIYENINRLVNLIGYHPKGCRPSDIEAYIQADESAGGVIENRTIPMFSFIETGSYGKDGSQICFSVENEVKINSESQHRLTLVNGKWKLFDRPFVSRGAENETFVLTGVKSDSDSESENKYVSGDHIKVIVAHPASSGELADADVDSNWYMDKEELFVGTRNEDRRDDGRGGMPVVYNGQQQVYSVRLNQDKEYEISFGDGIVGKKLKKGDLVYVFYLLTNGPDGNVEPDILDQNAEFKQIDVSGSLPTALKDLINGTNSTRPEGYTLTFGRDIDRFVPEEGVEDIRYNAPNWFKTGNRLITRSDYEYWIRANLRGAIDVKCMNNWEYLATFYRWLYQNGLKQYSDGRHFIDNNLITRYNCKYVDAADANNVYLWIKTETETSTTQDEVARICKNLKTITTEVEPLTPVNVRFDICAQNLQELSGFSMNQVEEFGYYNGQYSSYLEVTMGDEDVYINSNVQRLVANIFTDYFNKLKCTLGQTVNLNDILNRIYSLNGVVGVRTVCLKPDQDPNQARIIDGISMASWSDRLILTEDGYPIDLDVSNISRRLEPFQFPALNNPDEIADRIKVVKRQLANINTTKF